MTIATIDETGVTLLIDDEDTQHYTQLLSQLRKVINA
jgi:hypothetical protein